MNTQQQQPGFQLLNYSNAGNDSYNTYNVPAVSEPNRFYSVRQIAPPRRPTPPSPRKSRKKKTVQEEQEKARVPQPQMSVPPPRPPPPPYSFGYGQNPYGMNIEPQYQYGQGDFMFSQYDPWNHSSNFELVTRRYPTEKPPSEQPWEEEMIYTPPPLASPTPKRPKMVVSTPSPNVSSYSSPVRPPIRFSNDQNRILQQPPINPVPSPAIIGNKPATPVMRQSLPPQIISETAPHVDRQWNPEVTQVRLTQSPLMPQDNDKDPNKNQQIVPREISPISEHERSKTPTENTENGPNSVETDLQAAAADPPKSQVPPSSTKEASPHSTPVPTEPAKETNDIPPNVPGNPPKPNSTPSSLEGYGETPSTTGAKAKGAPSQPKVPPNSTGTHQTEPNQGANTQDISNSGQVEKQLEEMGNSNSQPKPDQNTQVIQEQVSSASMNVIDSSGKDLEQSANLVVALHKSAENLHCCFEPSNSQFCQLMVVVDQNGVDGKHHFNDEAESLHFEKNQSKEQLADASALDNTVVSPTISIPVVGCSSNESHKNAAMDYPVDKDVFPTTSLDGNSSSLSSTTIVVHDSEKQQPDLHEIHECLVSNEKEMDSTIQNGSTNSASNLLDISSVEDGTLPVPTTRSEDAEVEKSHETVHSDESFEEITMIVASIVEELVENSSKTETEISSSNLADSSSSQNVDEIAVLETNQLDENREEIPVDLNTSEISCNQDSNVDETCLETNSRTMNEDSQIILELVDSMVGNISRLSDVVDAELNQATVPTTDIQQPQLDIVSDVVDVVVMAANETQNGGNETSRIDVNEDANNSFDFADVGDILQQIVETVVMNSTASAEQQSMNDDIAEQMQSSTIEGEKSSEGIAGPQCTCGQGGPNPVDLDIDMDGSLDDLFSDNESVLSFNNEDSDYEENYSGPTLEWQQILSGTEKNPSDHFKPLERYTRSAAVAVPSQNSASKSTGRASSAPDESHFLKKIQSRTNKIIRARPFEANQVNSSTNEAGPSTANQSSTMNPNGGCFFHGAKRLRKRKNKINQYGTVRKKKKNDESGDGEHNHVDETNSEANTGIIESNEDLQNINAESKIMTNHSDTPLVSGIDNQATQNHFFDEAVVTNDVGNTNNEQMADSTDEYMTQNIPDTLKNIQSEVINTTESEETEKNDNVENARINENEAPSAFIEESVTTATNQREIEENDLEVLFNAYSASQLRIVDSVEGDGVSSPDDRDILETIDFESVDDDLGYHIDSNAVTEEMCEIEMDNDEIVLPIIEEEMSGDAFNDAAIAMQVDDILSDLLAEVPVDEAGRVRAEEIPNNQDLQIAAETEEQLDVMVEDREKLVDANAESILASVVRDAAFVSGIQKVVVDNSCKKLNEIIVEQVAYSLAEHFFQRNVMEAFTELALDCRELAAKYVAVENGLNSSFEQMFSVGSSELLDNVGDLCTLVHQSKFDHCQNSSSNKKLSITEHVYYFESIIQTYQTEGTLTDDKYFAVISLLCPSRINAFNYCLEEFSTRKDLLLKCINFLSSVLKTENYAIALFVRDRYVLEKLVDGFDRWLESSARIIGKLTRKQKNDFFERIKRLQKQFSGEVGEEHEKLINCMLSSLTMNFKVFGDQLAPVSKKLYPIPVCVENTIQAHLAEHVPAANRQWIYRWVKIMFQTTFGSRVLRFATKSTMEKQFEFYQLFVSKFVLFLTKLPSLLENHGVENGAEILQSFTDNDFMLFLKQEELLKTFTDELSDLEDEDHDLFKLLANNNAEKLCGLEKLKMEQEIFADTKVENFLKKHSPKIMLDVKKVLSVIDASCEKQAVKEYDGELMLMREPKGFVPESIRLLEKSIDYLWTVFDAMPKTSLIKCLLVNPILDGGDYTNFSIGIFLNDPLTAFLDLLNHILVSNSPKNAYLKRANLIVNEIAMVSWRMAIAKDRTKELAKLNEDVRDIATCLANELAKTNNFKLIRLQDCCDAVIIFTTLLFLVKSFPELDLSEVSKELGAICFGEHINMTSSGSGSEVTSLFAEKLAVETKQLTDEYFRILYANETFLFPPLLSQNQFGVLKLKYMLVELFAFLHDPAKFVWLILHVAKQRDVLMTMMRKVVDSLKVIVLEQSVHSFDVVFDAFKTNEMEANVLDQIMSEFELKKAEEGILLLLIGLYWTEPEQQPALRLVNISRFFDCPALFEKFGFLFDVNVKNIDIGKLHKFYYNDYLIKKVIDPDYQNVLYSNVENDLYDFYSFIDLNLPNYSKDFKLVMKHLLPECLRSVSEKSRRRALSVSF
uniref:Uncharacterized protein n=1 Tax=Panagrolaimus sp. JU765 TaxID=591449 RepID=A0AC34PV38_9BILA